MVPRDSPSLDSAPLSGRRTRARRRLPFDKSGKSVVPASAGTGEVSATRAKQIAPEHAAEGKIVRNDHRCHGGEPQR
jgi:hypothetical protein